MIHRPRTTTLAATLGTLVAAALPGAAATLGTLVAVALPGAASADIAVRVDPTDVPGQDTLVVTADGPGPNVVFVRYAAPFYLVTTAETPLTVGPGCLVTDVDAGACAGTIGSATVIGGEGTDVVDLTDVPVPVRGDGGAGDDALTAGAGGGSLTGGDGVDQLTGGAGRDELAGDGDDDWVLGLAGSDAIAGGAGDDVLEAGTGDQELVTGGAGLDLVKGGTGTDTLQGGAGSDVLVGGPGPDTLSPGTGADDVVLRVGSGDRVDCPTEVVDGELTATACATPERGAAPETWPPPDTAAAARTAAFARPITAGNATAVLVHVPATRWHWVRRCLRTYAARGVALRPYRIRFKARFFPTVSSPPPNAAALTARLTRSKRCGG